MNTVKSFWLGWGSLCVAGGTAYYFAKRSINEGRHTRFREAEEKRRRLAVIETPRYGQPNYSSTQPSNTKESLAERRSDLASSPSQEANLDPAPTRHDPENEVQRVMEKSKYEASEPYKTKKGDRFS